MNKTNLNKIDFLAGPVVIGGIGGSGTRLIFQLLIELGFYMGQDLSRAGDNLWFTVLFKRPDWFEKVSREDIGLINKTFELFEKLMTSNVCLKNKELLFFRKAVYDFKRQYPKTMAKVKIKFKNVIERQRIDFSNFIGWGWKEPNSFIYLKFLSSFFNNLKFIFVLRHGLDMAFAARNQYLFWYRFFGLDQKKGWENFSVPVKKLEYWLTANRFALDQGRMVLGRRFWVINFDKLCKKPEEEIDNLVTFLDIDKKKVNISELYAIPKIPDSMGRFKNHDLEIFPLDQLEAFSKFGFETDE